MKQMKRCLAWLLSVLMIFSMSSGMLVAFGEEATADVQEDLSGVITPDDARNVLRVAANLESVSLLDDTVLSDMAADTDYYFPGDVDRNGKIEAVDCRLLLRYSIGIQTLDSWVAPAMSWEDRSGSGSDTAPVLNMKAEPAFVGEEMTITVSATKMAGTETGALSFTYDPQYLEYVSSSHAKGNFMGNIGLREDSDDCIAFGFVYTESADADTELCTMTFKVLRAGDTSVDTQVIYWSGTEAPANTSVVMSLDEPSEDGPTTPVTTDPYINMSVDQSVVAVGDLITVTASGVNMVGTETATIFFEFDPEYLEYESVRCVSDGIDSASLVVDSDHTVSYGLMYMNYATEDTDFCEITFKVLKEGDIQILARVDSWTGIEAPADTLLTISMNPCEHENTVFLPEEPATCNAVGYTAGEYCGDCDTWLSGHEEIPMLPHANIVFYPEQEPTCTKVGYTEGERCEDCGTWLSGHEVIPTHPDADGDGFCDICGLDKNAPYLVLSPDTETPIVGREVTISVSGVNMVGTQTGTIRFKFDPEYLEFIPSKSVCTDNGFVGDVGVPVGSNDTASFGFMYMSSAKEDTELCQLTFKVLKTGDTEIIPIVDSWTGIGAPAVSPLTLSIPNPYREYTMAEGETLSIETDSAPFARVSFVPEVTGYYSLESFSDGDPGCSLNGGASGLDYITYDGDSGKFGKNFKLTAYLTAGETYCFDCYPAGMGSSTYDITLRYEGEEMPLYIYKVNEEDNAVIVGVTFAPSGDLVVPEELEGYPVTGISDAAFLDCEELKSVTLPASVTFIGDHALGYVYDEEATSYVPLDDFTICGVKDSEAERYAAANGFTFAEIVLCAHTETEIRNALAATCTTDGYTGDTYCVACDALLASGTAIPATGHSLEHVVVPSTCKVAGVEYDVCTNCGEAFNNTVLELGGHTTEKVPGKAATCTQAGLTDGAKCSVCGETLTEQTEIPATGHQFGEWMVVKNATFLAVGTEERSCKLCGLKETKEIPVLVGAKETVDVDSGMSVIYTDGTYDSDIKLEVSELFDGNAYQVIQAQKGKFRYQLFDITTTADGEKVQPNGTVLIKLPVPEGFSGEKLVVYYVSNTGTLEKMNSVVKDGYLYFEAEHFSSYAIVDESAERPAYMMGDLDGDGKITASDARHVLRIAAKLEVASVREDDLLQMADTNGDKTITAVDARKILRVAAKLDTF